jgi:hypothetical protein
MKSLDKFDNTDKLRLLHELFPQEIPALLEDILEFCKDFRENNEAYAKNWNSGFMPLEFWLYLSNETEKIINRYKFNLLRSSKVFADQLSYIHAVLFVNDRIIIYSDSRSQNVKFRLAVDMLFKTNPK